MCYQLPGSITQDGLPIVGRNDINATDYAFARKMYPPLTKKQCLVRLKPDIWEENDDVNDQEISERIFDVE